MKFYKMEQTDREEKEEKTTYIICKHRKQEQKQQLYNINK